MSGEIAAASDMMTGALTARALEPHAGEAHGTGATLCLNCGTRLIGEHCHRCGQSGHVHRTVGAIGHELLHGVFHFEGKIWRTLPMLMFRPGELTRRYIAGERARFVSPLALFLFSVFLMFAVVNTVGGEMIDVEPNPLGRIERSGQLVQQIAAEQAELRRVEARIQTAAPDERADLREKASDIRKRIAETTERRRAVLSGSGEGSVVDLPTTGWAKLDKGVEKANRNPGLLLYKVQSTAYKYSWLLILFSTPVVALLFLWRPRFGLYDHAVFVTYSLSFMMLLVILLMLGTMSGVPEGMVGVAAVLLPPIHIHKQLRGAYSLRRLSGLWRATVLVLFAGCVLITYVLLLFLYGVTS